MTTASMALQELTETAPKSYLNLINRTTNNQQGKSNVLRKIYEECSAEGLVPANAADDVARLHAIFDVALDHGLGSLIHDYIEEVCWDKNLTSSDPVEAFLLDGECVRRWCHKTLSVTRGRLTTWLSGGLASLVGSTAIQRELGRLRMLKNIVEALSATEAEEAQRLVQCAEIVLWLSSQTLMTHRPSGRFASEQEWKTVATRRRDGCAPNTLFIADLAIELGQHGVEGFQYPPPSLERLISTLFLHGSSSSAAMQTKIALLAYCLVDGGFMTAGSVATSLISSLHVSVPNAYSWLLQLFCDDAFSVAGVTPNNASLNQAAGFVPVVDGSSLPFKVIHVFLSKGRPDVALALLRQRSDILTLDITAASTALRVRLANGLLAEGFLELKQCLSLFPDKAENAQLLIGELLQWSENIGALQAVIRLPFAPLEEESAVLQWLIKRNQTNSQAGLMVVLYMLMRGRTPEAITAYKSYCQGRTLADEDLAHKLTALLKTAETALPAVARNALHTSNVNDTLLLQSIPQFVSQVTSTVG